MAVVHQMIAQKSSPTWQLIARCGFQSVRKPGDPPSPVFTAWPSKVTCEACKTTPAGWKKV